MIPEILDHHDLAVAKRHDGRDFEVRVRATTDTMPSLPADDPVASIYQADLLQFTGLPGVAQFFQEPQDGLPAEMRSGLRPILRGSHHGTRVVHLPEACGIRRGPCLVGGSHDLHVLLRHRLLRTTGASEARPRSAKARSRS